MNMSLIKEQFTMTTVEIAEQTGKQHGHVMRDTKKMLIELYGEKDISKFGAVYKDSYGRETSCYALPKNEVLTLVSGYSIPLRAKIVQRLDELENKKEISPVMTQAEMFAAAANQLVEQERRLVEQQKQLQQTQTEVDTLKHKFETNGCEPGYIPRRDAYTMYGQALSEDMFKLLMKKRRHPTSKYHFTTPDGIDAIGTSILEDGIEIIVESFIAECEQVSKHYFTHADFNRKRFKVFKAATC